MISLMFQILGRAGYGGAHTCNTSNQEAEAGESLSLRPAWVGYIVRPCFKQQQQQQHRFLGATTAHCMCSMCGASLCPLHLSRCPVQCDLLDSSGPPHKPALFWVPRKLQEVYVTRSAHKDLPTYPTSTQCKV
jgi:hypothetical protein